MKAWVSKYALTKGIFEIEAKEHTPVDKNTIIDINNCSERFCGEGREWHKTKKEALERAESLKQMKINNLKRQIEKLGKIKFD